MNENDNIFAACLEDQEFNNDEITDLFLNECEDDELFHETKSATITLNLEEYKSFLLVKSQLEKYKKVVKEMETKIKSKDSQIKELQRSIRRGGIHVSHLSDVSIPFFRSSNHFSKSIN